MKKHSIILILSFQAGMWFPGTSFSFDPPESILENCTTNEHIYFPTTIRTDVASIDRRKEAVRRALGISSSNPDYVTHMFNGQWFFEYENQNVVFAGYKIRSHYLQVAILLGGDQVTTILCNSSNLKQKKKSIHRKAPLWKEAIDSNIRIELGRESTVNDDSSNEIEYAQLDSLYEKGFILEDEYLAIRKRINDSYSQLDKADE